MDWFQLARDRIQWRAAFITIINVRILTVKEFRDLSFQLGLLEAETGKSTFFFCLSDTSRRSLGISAVFEASRICFTSLNR